jgi:hypothetical protein
VALDVDVDVDDLRGHVCRSSTATFNTMKIESSERGGAGVITYAPRPVAPERAARYFFPLAIAIGCGCLLRSCLVRAFEAACCLTALFCFCSRCFDFGDLSPMRSPWLWQMPVRLEHRSRLALEQPM